MADWARDAFGPKSCADCQPTPRCIHSFESRPKTARPLRLQHVQVAPSRRELLLRPQAIQACRRSIRKDRRELPRHDSMPQAQMRSRPATSRSISGPRKLKTPCSRMTAGRPFPPTRTLRLVRGAPMENLTHSASFDSDDNDAHQARAALR